MTKFFFVYFATVSVNVLIDSVQPMIRFLATFDNSLNLVFKMFGIKIFEVNIILIKLFEINFLPMIKVCFAIQILCNSYISSKLNSFKFYKIEEKIKVLNEKLMMRFKKLIFKIFQLDIY